MSLPKWLPFAAALLPLAAAAQQAQQENPADAHARVPGYRYESAFKNYRTAAEDSALPDTVWVGVNMELIRPHNAQTQGRAEPASSGTTPQHANAYQHHEGHHHHGESQ